MASKTPTEITEIEREAMKVANERAKAKQTEANNEFLASANRKLGRALEQAQAAPNHVQIGVATVSATGGVVGGYALNRKLRKVTAEKKMVNTKGERSMAAVAVSEGIPVAVGAGMIIIGLVTDKAMVSASMLPGGVGMLGGVALSVGTSPRTTQVDIKV
jgi:hypothetical protein